MPGYKFLKASGFAFKVLGWVSLALGIIAGIVILIGGGTPEAPRLTGLVGIALGIIYWFIFYTGGEVIKVLLDIRGKLEKGPSSI